MEVARFQADEEGRRVGGSELSLDGVAHLLFEQYLNYSGGDQLPVPVLVYDNHSALGLVGAATGRHGEDDDQCQGHREDNPFGFCFFHFRFSLPGWEDKVRTVLRFRHYSLIGIAPERGHGAS